MIRKKPITYSKLDRIEYVYACLAPYGVNKDTIRKVLDKDEEFCMEVLKHGDAFKYGAICKMKLRYVKPNGNTAKFCFQENDIARYEHEEHNRVSIQPLRAFNNLIKRQTYGNAYYFKDDD